MELGKIQKLYVVDLNSKGAYLNSKMDGNDNVILPKEEVPERIAVGDLIEVFIYRNANEKIVATTKRPKLTVGEIGYLQVVEITRFGAFLDWGMEKDLFLPFKEQKDQIVQGREYIVGVYVDKSNRMCATMKVYDLLSTELPYKVNDTVSAFVYSLNREMGAFVAVDSRYHAMIPKNEIFNDVRIGDSVTGRITKIRPDGKAYISIRDKAYKQMDKDAQVILDKLAKNKGRLLYNDKSSPAMIKAEFNMSKGSFKKAIGGLFKKRIIKITKDGIELIV